MIIGVNENHQIKQINNITDIDLIQYEVDREELFSGMSDIRILNYCYEAKENGYSVYPSIFDYHIDLLEIRDDLLKIKKEFMPEEEIESVDKISVLTKKLEFIKDYKWEVSYKGFEYDGYFQANKDRDVIKMRQCREGLIMGIVDSISWKLPDDTYKMIYDPNYFLQMELTSTLFTEKCFEVERIIQEELNQIENVDDLVLYDEKAEFDKLLLQILNEAKQTE